jgi:Tol biopolymer transport system component
MKLFDYIKFNWLALLIVMLLSRGVIYSEDGGDKKLIKPLYTKVYSDLKETTYPVISPNGKFIVFNKIESSTQANLFIIPSDGSKSPVRITTGNYLDSNPKWSPLGDKIVFSSERIGGVSEVFTLAISQESGVASDELKRITLSGGECPEWSPDAKQILYVNAENDAITFGINLIPSNGGLPKTIGSTRRVLPMNVKFSKDGKYIYFNKYDAKGWSIYKASSNGGESELLYDKHRLLDISPSGNLLLMGGSLIGPANGKGEIQIISTLENMQITSWGNDENSLIASSTEYISILRIINSYGGQYRNLTDGTKYDYPPAWSPDGKVIAYMTNLNGSTALMLIPASGGAARQIPTKNLLVSNSLLIWSPDGKKLATRPAGKKGILIIDTELNKENLLLPKDSISYAFVWSNDSRSIYYQDAQTFSNKKNFINRVGLDGKVTKIVSPKPWQAFATYQPVDQEKIYLIRRTVARDSSFLICRSLKSKKEKEILRLKGSFSMISISPNGKLAVFSWAQESSGNGIYLISFDELKPVKIATAESVWGFNWDKDGSRIFFIEEGKGEPSHIKSISINDRQKLI